jgi:phenylacetate-CoA ligase
VARKKLGPVPLASVICTAEQLSNEWRERISEVLGVPVYAYYGCGEINSLGYMHGNHQDYIIPEEHVVLEAVSEKSERFAGTGRGLACITTLTNFVMPMIRYVNGDELELGYLDNGMAHKRILQLHGRVASYLHALDGHRVSGALSAHMVLRAALPVWKWQLVQRRPDCVEFHYLPAEGRQFDYESVERVKRILRHTLGDTMRVDCIEGDFEIPANGKHLHVVNRLEANPSGPHPRAAADDSRRSFA